FVLRIASFGFEQLLLVPNQIVPDKRNITPQGVIICRFLVWRRDGIKSFARAVGIIEPNGTTCPGTQITLSILAQFSYSSPTLDLVIQPQHDGALRRDCRSQSAVGVNSRGIINLRYRRTHDEIAMDRSRRSSHDPRKFCCANSHSICCSPANRASGVLEYSMVSRPTPQCPGRVGTGANRIDPSRYT